MAQQKKKIIIIDDVELNRTILGEAFSKKYAFLAREIKTVIKNMR